MRSRVCASRSSTSRSEEHTSELQSRQYLVCRLLLEKKNNTQVVVDAHHSKTQLLADALDDVEDLRLHGDFERGGGLVGDEDFFFNDTATTEIYTLSLHDALPI